jgi:hypothetical protein
VEVALRDPAAFAKQPPWAATTDSNDDESGGGGVASGLRVLPVFVLSDLARSPSLADDRDSSSALLAFDHGLLVKLGARGLLERG